MTRIFISYRRSDSMTITGRIYDRLVDAFGEENVFKDVDNLPIGVDFRSVINREIGSTDALLVIIGPDWVQATDDHGLLRLENPNDFVRMEIEHALRRKTLLIVPVLVRGAVMPPEHLLPASMRDLLFRHAAVVRDDPDFRRDVARLIEQVTRYVNQNTETTRVPRAEVQRVIAQEATPPLTNKTIDAPTQQIPRRGTGPLTDPPSKPRPPELPLEQPIIPTEEHSAVHRESPPTVQIPTVTAQPAVNPRLLMIGAAVLILVALVVLFLLARGG